MAYAAYVVTVGKRPGVYVEWLDAKWQTLDVPGAAWKGYATIAAARAAFDEQRRRRQIRAVATPEEQEYRDSDVTDVDVPDGAVSHIRSPGRGARERVRARTSPAHSARSQAPPAWGEHQRRTSPRHGRVPSPHHSDSSESIGELHEVEQAVVHLSLSGTARRSSRNGPESAHSDASGYSYYTARASSHRSPHARSRQESTRREWDYVQRDRMDARNVVVRASDDRHGSRQSSFSSPPTEQTRYEDGDSPLIHLRPSRADGMAAPQHRSRGHAPAAEPRQGPMDLTAPRQSAHNPFRQMSSRGIDDIRAAAMHHNGGTRDRGIRTNEPATPTRLPHRAPTNTIDLPLVPTVPNSPVEGPRDLPADPYPIHSLEDACIQGRVDMHNVKICRPYREWLKRNPGSRDPLQESFRGERLSRSRSEPVAGSSSSSRNSVGNSGTRTPSALSAHLTMSNLPNDYREGPAGATPLTSPNTASRSHPGRTRSANALGLSQGNALSSATMTFESRNGVRSPITRGTAVPLSAFGSMDRPSPRDSPARSPHLLGTSDRRSVLIVDQAA